VLQQLLLWLPADTRLYWLLGEAYNADGDVKSAAYILDQLVFSAGINSEELRQHARILKAAPKPVQTAPTPDVPPPAAPPAPAGWGLDWRQLGVGFLAGVGIALLIGLQLQLLWRRRQQTARAPVNHGAVGSRSQAIQGVPDS